MVVVEPLSFCQARLDSPLIPAAASTPPTHPKESTRTRPTWQYKGGKEAGTDQPVNVPKRSSSPSLHIPFTPTVYNFSHSLVLDRQARHSLYIFPSGIDRSQRSTPEISVSPHALGLSLVITSLSGLRRLTILDMAGGKWRNRLRRVRDRLLGRSPPGPTPEELSMPPPPLPSKAVPPPPVSPTAVRTKPPVVQLGPTQPAYYFPTSEGDDGQTKRREPDFIPTVVTLPSQAAPPQAKGAYRAKAPAGGLGALPSIYLNQPIPTQRQQQQRLYQPMPLQQRQPQQYPPPPSPRAQIPLNRVATHNAQAAGLVSSSRTPLSPGGNASPNASRSGGYASPNASRSGGYASPNASRSGGYASPSASMSGGSGGSGSSTGGSPGGSSAPAPRYRHHHGLHRSRGARRASGNDRPQISYPTPQISYPAAPLGGFSTPPPVTALRPGPSASASARYLPPGLASSSSLATTAAAASAAAALGASMPRRVGHTPSK